MMNETISILGCGWLGLPLAKSLIHSGYRVRGSTTTQDKASLLRNEGIDPFLLQSSPVILGERLDMFFKSEILVITLPFRRNFDPPRFYCQQMKAVLSAASDSPIEFIIFTSSTSIYPDSVGMAKEEEQFVPNTPRAQALLDAENLLRKSSRFDATIIRFAGMYGGERKIGRLSGGKGLKPGNHPVNLIHRDDCVAIIQQVIRQNIRNEVFNACSDQHPSRRELYTQAALKQGFAVPSFPESSNARGKIVSNEKIKQKLHYGFKHPDPMLCLDHDE